MRLTNRRALWIAVAVATVALAGAAYAAPQSSSQAAAKKTIELTEESAVPKLKVIDVGDPGLSQGDQVVTTDGLLDRKGAVAGSLEQVCTVVSPGANLFASTFDCTGSFDLADGSITVQGSFVPVAEVSSLAVTGGTGEFAKARGEAVIATEADTITVELA